MTLQHADFSERVVEFDCRGARLLGLLATPTRRPARSMAILIVVGGPQYRVGSHRQFVMLARHMAAEGFATLRFDYRGMGDSEGEPRAFDDVADDLRAGIDALCHHAGTGSVTVFGLCDAASAALIFATSDHRVRGLALVNPWVRSEASLAATHVKHYYGARLVQAEFWRKVLAGQFGWRASLRSGLRDVAATWARRGRRQASAGSASFQSRMATGLKRFPGRVLLILSGNDLTAREFIDYTQQASDWEGLLGAERVDRFDLPGADHTFSNAAWRAAVVDRMLEWLRSA